MLVLFLFGSHVTTIVATAQTESNTSDWTQERVNEISNRGETYPDALWELKDAPIELVYQPLHSLWMIHFSRVTSRLEMKKKGREAEYLKEESEFGHDPEYSAKMFQIARDVMLAHPDYEAYLSGKLKRLTEVLLRAETDNDYRAQSRDFPGAYSDYTQYLGVAYNTPGDMAFRMVGPGVLGAYYPPADFGDYIQTSPASRALGALASLAKERFGEDIPKDIEGARQWWRTNEHRFAAKPPPPPQSPPSHALLSSRPDASAHADAPTTDAKDFRKIGLLLCLIVGVTVLVAFAIFRARRKS